MKGLYIGLMSGTSADGIDAVLVDFNHDQPKLIAQLFTPYSANFRNRILALRSPGDDEVNRMGELDILVGKQFGKAANTLLQQNKLNRLDIDAIGSHGQTIRHHPQRGFTIQIGDPNVIAAETGITTVADFRRRDIAFGGQGAPLVPAFHRAVFSTTHTNRIIANIGGIANITLLPTNQNEPVLGFDTGPGNVLLDAWIEKQLQQPFDDQGTFASTGSVNNDLLEQFLCDSYFKLPPPKSTGPEYFNLNWLNSFISNLNPADIQATLVDLTAYSILNAINPYFSTGEIFICGGGARNRYLMQRLQFIGQNYQIYSTEKLRIHPDWVEATAFAWLAKQTLAKKPGNLTSVTGAKQASILGGIYFA